MTDRPVIRVILVDDHPIFRAGVRALLAAVPDVVLVGEAGDGDEGVRLAATERPDVALMDLQMPTLGGVEATRRLREASPDTAVLVLTMIEDDHSVFAAMRAGARGYVLKDADEEEILRAVRAVAHGEALFGPAVATRVARFFERPPEGHTDRMFPGLTEREREILEFIARGERNAAIAVRLSLSPKTIRNHVTSIFDKLEVAGRAEAIIRAREAGLGGA